MIEKVLKMMNEPTRSDTIANTSRNVLKNERFFFRLLWLSCVILSPEITSMFFVPGWSRSAARMLWTTWSCDTPGSAFTLIAS